MKVVRLAIAYKHGDWPMVQWLCDHYGQELGPREPNPNTAPRLSNLLEATEPVIGNIAKG